MAITACSDAVGPSEHLTPRLQDLRFETFRSVFDHGGFLWIDALPADTSFRLQPGQRVPVEVSTSSGDLETVGLYRLFCPARQRSWPYTCFTFAIFMKDGFTVADVADHVAAIGGRMKTLFGERTAQIVVFSPYDVIGHATRARSWPGVALTELHFPSCQDWAPPTCSSLSWLRLPVPIDTGTAILGDGILQIRAFDTITVSYAQPGGGSIAAEIRLQ